jgi:hypothetical protein
VVEEVDKKATHHCYGQTWGAARVCPFVEEVDVSSLVASCDQGCELAGAAQMVVVAVVPTDGMVVVVDAAAVVGLAGGWFAVVGHGLLVEEVVAVAGLAIPIVGRVGLERRQLDKNGD